MLLLGIVMFIFGVTFMQLAYNHLRSGAEPGDIMEYFGTLGRCLDDEILSDIGIIHQVHDHPPS